MGEPAPRARSGARPVASTAALPSDVTAPPRPDWFFHSFDLPDGAIDGARPLAQLNAEAELILTEVQGRRVLDIGAWDGFFAFEAERRGAAEVLATDHWCWSGPGIGTKAGFDHVHHRLGSAVRALDVDIPDLDPAALGTFDLVLLLGVLYHVEDPYLTLKRAAALCREHLVLETETALRHEPRAAFRLYDVKELAGDPTNVWAPNAAGLRLLLKRLGFMRVEIAPSPSAASLIAYQRSGRGRLRQALSRLGLVQPYPHWDRGRVIVHAWR